MLKVISLTAIAALALAVTATSQPAFARDDGAVAAGVIGGLAVGAVIGSQINRGYYRAARVTMSRAINLAIANAISSGKRLNDRLWKRAYAARSRLRLTFSSA